MGSIIGKGGSNINEFRTKSSVFVKAFPQKLQNSDERVLLIKGQKENIIQCMKMLFGNLFAHFICVSVSLT